MTRMNYFFEDKDIARDFLNKSTKEIDTDKKHVLSMFDEFILNSTFDDGSYEIIFTYDNEDKLREVSFINHEAKEFKIKKTKKDICKYYLPFAIVAGIFFSLGVTTRRRNGF